MNKGNIIEYNEDDDNYNSYSDEIKNNISNYGSHYEYTKQGLKNKISEMNEQIQILTEQRNKFEQKLNKEK